MNEQNEKTMVPRTGLAGSLALAVVLDIGAAGATTDPQDRRAQPFEATFPWFQSEPVSCPGHYLDGVLVSGTITVKGLDKNDGFLTPWVDNAGGEHLHQRGKLTFDLWSDDGAYEWEGQGRGKSLYQGGGGNGDHFGGVVFQSQQEYYQALGDYPDLFRNVDFAMVVDANGNIRVFQSEGSFADGAICVLD